MAQMILLLSELSSLLHRYLLVISCLLSLKVTWAE